MNKMKLVPLGALLVLTSSSAFADVTHEIIMGIESDSSSKVTDDTVNKVFPALSSSTDLSDTVEESNSMFTLSYSYFLSPIKDDDTPIDIRGFYQHPSKVSVGIASINGDTNNRSDPALTVSSDMSATALMFGAEYYLPSDTGFMIGLGGGSGEITVNAGGAAKADVDLTIFNLGIRQYAAKNVALHMLLSNEETSGDVDGIVQGSLKDTKKVATFGGRFVFNDRVGLLFELGRGEKESKSPFSTVANKPDTYDVAEVKTELAFFGNKQFTMLLGVELSGQFQTGMPAGEAHEITESKVRLVPRYWFNENLGMEVGLYSISNEEKEETLLSSTTTTTTSGGIQLNVGYRF